MHIPKIYLGFCALVLGASLTLQAADNPDQAAARAALEAKMKELDAQQPLPAENPTPSADNSVVMTPVSEKSNSADQAKAKKEADKKLAAQRAAEAKAEKAAAKAKAKADEQAAAAAKKADEDAARQAAKEAAAQKQADEAAAQALKVSAPSSASGSQSPSVETPPVASDYPGKNLGLNPIVVPALPISAAKQEKLDALLVKYKADQITPEEYHTQRAAILAEP
jgi:superfamily II DNA/RNA helicase